MDAIVLQIVFAKLEAIQLLAVIDFKPAVFSIGVYPIWFVSFTWEYGQDQAPTVLVEDENLVTPHPTKLYVQNDAEAYALRYESIAT